MPAGRVRDQPVMISEVAVELDDLWPVLTLQCRETVQRLAMCCLAGACAGCNKYVWPWRYERSRCNAQYPAWFLNTLPSTESSLVA
ncbi:hypothetical protein LZ31DRAFT_334882 [Colletotrichum somersetense]|nr:hypothetical protein LZ31DRAFT_334882 [Colletotrichum somersetense]